MIVLIVFDWQYILDALLPPATAEVKAGITGTETIEIIIGGVFECFNWEGKEWDLW